MAAAKHAKPSSKLFFYVAHLRSAAYTYLRSYRYIVPLEQGASGGT